MNLDPRRLSQPKDRLQSRLLSLAAAFVILTAIILTLSPAVRLHSWQVEYRWSHWLGVGVWLAGFLAVHRQVLRWLPRSDPFLLPAAALLSGWGLITIWRLDEGLGMRQAIWLGVCLALVWGLFRIPHIFSRLRRYKYLWLVLGLALTGMTFIFGTYPGGTGPHLWLGANGVYLQPSEPLKLLLIIYLAAYLADQLPVGFNLLQMLTPTLVMVLAALGILVAQRDMGTATLFILLYAALVFIASGRRRILAICIAILGLAGTAGYQLFSVIQVRIDSWINPWADPTGTSYQVIQSLISTGAGGIFGTGLGLGSPGVVPVAHSDFIFAAITEEFGLLGAGALFILIGLLAIRGLGAALHARSVFQRYLAAGLTIYLVLQSLVIIGGNLGVLPLTGVTLPFVSYGGSSLLTSFLSLFLILQVSSQGEDENIAVPNPRPFLLAGVSMLGGIALMALVAGWWGMMRSTDLQSRQDNPRWFIGQRYVVRGQILDHNNQPIAETVGTAGGLRRQVNLPGTGSLIGYTHPLYGQAGLEASLDPYLRGLQGTPSSSIILSQLLYAQTPPGNDVRLSLDINIQQSADDLLNGHTAALVVLNARSGEILALSSHPNFDPNQLDARWDFWMKNERSVFLNRAVQGLYPPGAALAPFLLAETLAEAKLSPAPQVLDTTLDGIPWACALEVSTHPSWSNAVANGCPGSALSLGLALPVESVARLYSTLGFDQVPQLPLPVADASALIPGSPDKAALGQANVSVSPLQMALAAAMLSSSGVRPAPQLATAVHTPNQGWVALPSASIPSPTVLQGAADAADALRLDTMAAWSVTATALTSGKQVTWFLAGTLPDWKGVPVALALVIEDAPPILARQIGDTLLQSLLKQ